MIDGVIVAIPFYVATVAVLATSLQSIPRLTPAATKPSIDPATGRMTFSPEMLAVIQPILTVMFAAFAIFLLVQAVYHTLLWWRFGATLGQRALGIQIRRVTDGSRMGFWRSAMRFAGYLVSSWAFYLGFVWVGIDGRKQGWHDKIAGTVAIRRTA
jgi:uncharacterized RDD family membrane protein YckC